MSDKETNSPITVKEEEIDLGKLFSLIGKMFSNLFSFIGNLLKGVFHYLILLLIFLKTNIIKLFIVTIIGFTSGLVIDTASSSKYSYDMIVEPNYSSVDQMLEKMEYYNVLIREEDSIALSNEFGITFGNANNLVSFELNPYESKKDQLVAYDKFIKETDTLTHLQFSFSDFVGDGTSIRDSRYYVYRIVSKDSRLKSFEKKLIYDVELSPTLQKRRKLKLNTLKLDSTATRLALGDIKSLRELYKEVTLMEVENQSATPNTYIDFSKETNLNNDIELFNIAKELNNNLIFLEKDKEKSDEIVNVITPFNPVGNDRSTFTDSNAFVFGRFFLGAVLVLLLLKRVNQYLNKYQSNK